MYIEKYCFLTYFEGDFEGDVKGYVKGDFACFIILTIDGAASVLWRKLTVDACSLQMN